MTDGEPRPGQLEGGGPVTPARRQRVVDFLCEAYAQDQIGVRELERRLDDANRARLDRELENLVSDLSLTSGTALPGEREQSSGVPAGIQLTQSADRRLSVGFWSGRVRRGNWVPARRITAIALQGGGELDFREATFGASVVEVTALAVMGGIQIIVPPDLRVEASGFAVMGGFHEGAASALGGQPEGTTVRIRGFALMGAIDVDVRLPGETAREAKARRRKERRTSRS